MGQGSPKAELRTPSTTTLVSAALAILVFCGQILGSKVVAFFPDAMLRVIRPTYVPVAIALLLLALCRERRSWGLVGVCAVACVAAMMGLPFIKDDLVWELLPLLLCALAVGDSDIGSLARVCFWASLGSLIVVVAMDALCLSSAGWRKPNWYWAYSYGLNHPNSLGSYLYFTLSAMTLGFDRKRFRLPLLLCYIGAMLFTFFALSCRTAAVLELMLAAFIAIEGLRPRWVARLESTRALPMLVALGTVVLALLMLAGAMFYDERNAFLSLLDRMTNMRISHGKQAFDYLGGYTLFSRVAELPTQVESLTTGVGWILVDSAYIRYGLLIGLIPGLCLLAMLCRAAFVGRGSHDGNGSAMLWVVVGLGALYCVTETHPMYITRNCALLVFAWGLLPKARRHIEVTACDELPLREGEDARPLLHTRSVPALPTVFQAIGVVLFGAVLCLLACEALGNGTGELDVVEEFPHTTSVSCSSTLVADEFFSSDPLLVTAGDPSSNTLVRAEFSPGERVRGEVLGNTINGMLLKWETRGDAVRYLVSPADHDTDPIGGDWGVYLMVPGRGKPGAQEGRWALCMMDCKAETTRSLWLELKDDGVAAFGCAELDATVAKDAELRPFERKGTWETVEVDGATCVVCNFGDEQLAITIGEEGE